MVVYDLTDITTAPRAQAVTNGDRPVWGMAGSCRASLSKIPCIGPTGRVLIEVQDALRLESNDHYTWIVTSADRLPQ